MNAFYALLREWIGGKEYTSQLITKEDYNARVNFLLCVNEGDTDCREGFLTGNTNAYKWIKRYHVYKYGDDSAVLVLCPKKIGAVDVTKIPLAIFNSQLIWSGFSSTCGRSTSQTIVRVLRFFIVLGTSMAT